MVKAARSVHREKPAIVLAVHFYPRLFGFTSSCHGSHDWIDNEIGERGSLGQSLNTGGYFRARRAATQAERKTAVHLTHSQPARLSMYARMLRNSFCMSGWLAALSAG